jgi:hypothetical protein
MNLAQLIAPEWARDGLPERFAVRAPAPLPPMGLVQRSNLVPADRDVKPAKAAQPAAKGPGTGRARVSASNFFPGGRRGKRFDLLSVLGKRPGDRLDVAALRGLLEYPH